MIGSDAVIGLPDDKTVFEYDLADKVEIMFNNTYC